MFAISHNPIDPRACEAEVATRECGAVVTFIGIVRAHADDGRPVTGLAYEAYESMAVEQFETISNEARERYGCAHIAIVHRVGELVVGDVAVVVSVASAHRDAAFEACAYAIRELKNRAAIWKKERYIDGGGEWIANACASDGVDAR